MKIIAVGMNYAQHNQELGHTQVNTEPVVFMKPDSAILKDGKPFFIPDFSNEIHYETELVGKDLGGIPIFHSDDFEAKMKEYDVNIGVLTVPINIAQEITNKMVDGGIKAVWNFTPFRIRVPENIVVQNTSLYAHLAVMFNRLNFNEK